MQISYYKRAHEELECRLRYIAVFEAGEDDSFFKSIVFIHKCLLDLKAYMRANPFKRLQDEIYFFKRIKPVIISKLHCLMVINHEGNRSPYKAVRIAYWMAQLEEYRKFFKENKEFGDYMVENDNVCDSIFFVSRAVLSERAGVCPPLEEHPTYPFFGPDFSTIYDYRLAMWIAYTKLKIFAQRRLEELGSKLLN